MKHFAASFLALVVLVAVAQIYVHGMPSDPHIKAAAEKCQASEHATPADMQALMSHSMDLTKEAKCVISCMLKDIGELTDDGHFKKDGFMKIAQDITKGDATLMQHAVEMFDICQGQSDPDTCELAYKYIACMKSEMVARKIDIMGM